MEVEKNFDLTITLCTCGHCDNCQMYKLVERFVEKQKDEEIPDKV